MEIDKDYLRRLIKGVRHQAGIDPETVEAKNMFDMELITARWIDAELLCLTIEQDILGDVNEN